MTKLVKKVPSGILESLKSKLIEVGVDYAKKNIEQSKKQIVKYIEKNIEKKIKKEIKKTVNKSIAFILFGLGASFLLFGFISMIVSLLSLPTFISPLTFGGFLFLVGLIIYLGN